MPTNSRPEDLYPDKYLKYSDFGDVEQPVFTISDVNDEIVGQQKDRRFVLNFKETIKLLVINKTNLMSLEAMYGNIPNNWNGKRVTLFGEQVNYLGKTTMAVRISMIPPKANGRQPSPVPGPGGLGFDDESDIPEPPEDPPDEG